MGGNSRHAESHTAFAPRKDKQAAPGAGKSLVAGASWGRVGQTQEVLEGGWLECDEMPLDG